MFDTTGCIHNKVPLALLAHRWNEKYILSINRLLFVERSVFPINKKKNGGAVGLKAAEGQGTCGDLLRLPPGNQTKFGLVQKGKDHF